VINREPTPVRTSPRSRRVLVIAAVVLVILLLMLRSIATFWTDFLWYDSVDQTRVWRTLIFTRVGLVIVASLVAFALFYANLWLADRLSPRGLIPAGSPDEELLERFHDWIAPRVVRVRLAVSAFFGLMIGLGAASWWQDFLLFRHGGSFGKTDPIFENDIGLYVFKLPLYRDLFGWGFQLFLVIALVTAAVHYLNGGIQVGGQQMLQRVNPGVKVHLSVLFAILALLKAFAYQLDKWELLNSTLGRVIGAGFADVNARIPALNLLIVISIVAAVILLVNLRFRGWTLPLVAIGLWLFTSLVVGGLYPSLIQRFRVTPDEINKEDEFVAHNIAATRDAFDLAEVDVRRFEASADLTSADLAENTPTVDNIRLWDPGVLITTYRQLQEIRTFYGINDVDVDRYMVDGELTQMMVSARSLDEPNIPGSGWVTERLVYTHGFGAVLGSANAITNDGRPDFVVRDIPPVALEDGFEIDQPRIYFSDAAELDYVIAATRQPEVDFPAGESGSTVQSNSYDGNGGIDLGGVMRRAAFTLRFGDIDVLISGQLESDSKVLLRRNIRDRVDQVTPFLEADADPYLVALDGRLLWVMDLYTLSDRYPYSAPASTGRLDQGPGLPNNFNYIRNSVKATVDAFDGTMRFYVVDDTDPLIRAYQRMFPTVFTDDDQMPPGLRDHLRYPEDLFRVQMDMYELYHMIDARQFFETSDPWQIAKDPSNSPRTDLRRVFRDNDGVEFRPMLPYYLLMRLPGDDELSFLNMQPFTPLDRPNMVSFVVAKSGPQGYGEIIDYRLPATSAQDGPGQVGDLINQDRDIAAEFTLLDQAGSEVIKGNMLIIPVEESLLYVQPIYIRAQQTGQDSQSGIPEFKRVVVSFNKQIEIGDTLDDALALLFDGVVPSPGDGEPGDGGELPGDALALLEEAAQAFDEATEALRNGDLQRYAEKVAEAEALVRQALELGADSAAVEAAFRR
jgi:uncharacterized membrane protein (UPF0182 family)